MLQTLMPSIYSISVFYLMTSEHVWCFLLALSFMYLCFEILPLHKYICCCCFFFEKYLQLLKNPVQRLWVSPKKSHRIKSESIRNKYLRALALTNHSNVFPSHPKLLKLVHITDPVRQIRVGATWRFQPLATKANS